jgi:hypothetical protein
MKKYSRVEGLELPEKTSLNLGTAQIFSRLRMFERPVHTDLSWQRSVTNLLLKIYGRDIMT